MINKPEILSGEEIKEVLRAVFGNIEILIMPKDEDRAVARAQCDKTYKDMLKQFVGLHNMRNVGGVEPEWAMSNKQYQALQSQLEEDICPECLQHRPDDERVKNGMKCGFCAY